MRVGHRTGFRSPASLPLIAVAACLTALDVANAHEADENETARRDAREIREISGIKGGVVVHLNCGNGRLTAALRAGESYLVQGLDADAKNVRDARDYAVSRGLYGNVSAREWPGGRLPYIDNCVNLLVVTPGPREVDRGEVLRVLAPGGVAVFPADSRLAGNDTAAAGAWAKLVKPRPEAIDEWTHYLHDSTNNAVAQDTVVGPPRRMQWEAGPKWSRHHHLMGSITALVSAGGRIFYVIDEGTRAIPLLPPEYFLIARDAFNGVMLWKRPMEDWWSGRWLLKSGPFQISRRVVAVGDRLYIPLGCDGPLSVLDAATGELIRTYERTGAVREVVLCGGTLFIAAWKGEPPKRDPYNRAWVQRFSSDPSWGGGEHRLMAVDAETGEVRWEKESSYSVGTLAADPRHVCFHDTEGVVCLEGKTGRQLWKSEPLPGPKGASPAFMPCLLLYGDVVVFAGENGPSTMTALSAETGAKLWADKHPASEYASPKCIAVADGLVWAGSNANLKGSVFTGRDPHTGAVEREVFGNVDTVWYHHRCYAPKATTKYIIPSHTGTEFADLRNGGIEPQHWVRGGCSYGVMPANGLTYFPPHPCACYMLGTLKNFNALAAETEHPKKPGAAAVPSRLEKGPAYPEASEPRDSPIRQDDAAWPAYRHDSKRSGSTKAAVSENLKPSWQAKVGGKLSALTVADGKVFVASVDRHTVYAYAADRGELAWSFTAAGRVDSPPTISRGRCYFGSHDGWVYCLRSSDGAILWRYLAAPEDRQLGSYDQLESVWPVHGSVLVAEDDLYCVAGRSMFLDGGLRLVRLDPATGSQRGVTVLDEYDPETSVNVHDIIGREYLDLSMPTMLPDILSTDGQFVYMCSQRFDMQGKRQAPYVPKWPIPEWPGGFGQQKAGALKGKPLEPWFEKDGEKAHLFASGGFLDDSCFHRNIWVYAGSFLQGVAGYRYMNRLYAAGKILVFDDDLVYGYGNQPEYDPELLHSKFQLFAAAKSPEHALFEDQEKITFSHGPKQKIVCRWSDGNLPLYARAIVLAGRTLFVAGPPNLIEDEKLELWGISSDPLGLDVEKLAAQSAALRGARGGLLLAVDADTGSRLAEYKLDCPPAWDGMAAAYGRLFVATLDGKLVCMSGSN